MTHPFDDQPSIFATSIIILANLMPDDRRVFFLEWLFPHIAQIAAGKNDPPERLYTILVKWFASMPHENARHEYRTVVHEICWWEDLKVSTLKRMLSKARSR
jgi:hypothetical protein